MMLELRDDDADEDEAWANVERVDTADGMVHIDRYKQDGSKTKDTSGVPAKCRNDLDAAFRWALEYIWDAEERVSTWK